MRLTKEKLKQIIKEEMTNILNESQTQATGSKLKSGVMSSGQFATSGKDQRVDANPEVDNNEKSLINQIDAFLLKLAALPGVELSRHRATLQTILRTLEKKIGATANASQTQTKKIGATANASQTQTGAQE